MQQSADRKSRSAAEAFEAGTFEVPSRSALDRDPTANCPTITRSRQDGDVEAEDRTTAGSTTSNDDGDIEATSSVSVPVSDRAELTGEPVLPRSSQTLSDEFQDRVPTSGSGNEVVT